MEGIKVVANLYLPADYDEKSAKKYAAVTVAHPNGGCKEQVAGLYADEFWRTGFVCPFLVGKSPCIQIFLKKLSSLHIKRGCLRNFLLPATALFPNFIEDPMPNDKPQNDSAQSP